ncbi:MAG: coenzyme F420-0:L-glutamate ligase [Solirubrobacteraceae bacterium]
MLRARALGGIPEVRPGEDLAGAIAAALDGEPTPARGALVAVAHTVVSKAEGALVHLAGVRPGPRALELAAEGEKDPRFVQVVLDESVELLRAERGVLISRTRHGFVCANAGVDASNAGTPPGAPAADPSSAPAADPTRAGGGLDGGEAQVAILLPRDPDASARTIRRGLAARLGLGRDTAPAVMITDSFGRAWRHGQVDVAIGLAGLQPLDDWRGRSDADGMQLRATWLAIADAAAGAADLVRAKDSREPVVVIEGLERFWTEADGPGAAALLRPLDEDMFR